MLCKACNKQYNDGINMPRILIACGHTECEDCIQKHLSLSKIQCAECGKYSKANTPIEFPQNLMLLNMVANIEKGIQKVVLCPNHSKQLEAFCEQEKSLICIDCILMSGHKSHEINSIPVASEREKARMKETHAICEEIGGQLNKVSEQIRSYKLHITEASNQSINEISTVINELRNIIDKFENEIKDQILSIIEADNIKLQEFDNEIFQQKGMIELFNKEYAKISTEDNILILQSKIKREELSEMSTKMPPNFNLDTQFPIVTKEMLAAAVIKAYLPSYKLESSELQKKQKLEVKPKAQIAFNKCTPKKITESSTSRKMASTDSIKITQEFKTIEKSKAVPKNGRHSSKGFKQKNESIENSLSPIIEQMGVRHLSSEDNLVEINKKEDGMNLLKIKREQFKEQKAKDNDIQKLLTKQILISDQLKKGSTLTLKEKNVKVSK